MTVFSGSEAIKAFLKEFDSWLSESVTVYLLGGSAMTVHGLKDQTEDIDLALGVVSEFEHVDATLFVGDDDDYDDVSDIPIERFHDGSA
ncbi:hypothetical protein Z052_16995 [Halorubrum sp. C191]|nr:hypothetical protein Z052_16995 [Halorubrum sp. C191]